MSVLTAQNI